MKNKQGGFADHVTIIIGILLCLLMIGFFRSNNGALSKVSFKSLLRLPCGLTYSGISDNDKVLFPLKITGYVNGCGWDSDDKGAGTIQVFDGKGMPVTIPFEMAVTDNSTEIPHPFESDLTPAFVPQTDNGQIVIKSNSGLIQIIPVTF